MKHLKILRVLTILPAFSLTIVSVAGTFLPETYSRDSASLGAQCVGQDLVDLFVGVPLLLISFLSGESVRISAWPSYLKIYL